MNMRTVVHLCLVMVWMWFAAAPLMVHAQPVNVAVESARQRMQSAAGGPVEMTQSSVTGLATFVAAPPGKPIQSFVPPTASLEDRGWDFLETYGDAFGITARDQVQVQGVKGPDDLGMEHVRYRQVHRGVPVTAGEVIVHLRGGNMTAMTAKTLPDLDAVETTPTVTPEEALAVAQEVLAKHLKVTDAKLTTPRLEIFNRGLLEGRRYPTRLAWFIEATKTDVREFIWIDAQRGAVLLHFKQLTDARSRSIYNANNGSTLPGTLMRSEGGPATGDADADKAYDYSGDTYDYFFSQHGRDSYDGAGAPLISTVHYCPDPSFCPYPNAFWDGTQMVYGDGFSAADDVVAHELTHAVTEHAANLFYYMQSGALNESFSDIFGETVDLTNGRGTDTAAVRWFMGEDLSVGAIRNMMDPTLFGDPGKVSDPQLVCETPGGDGGGVHSNSGVPNHAYALVVDGGTYNGQTITGIGLTKAGKIQYRTLTAYLLSASDFLDNYSAVQQACADLVGSGGITAADCTQVKRALDAVEMANTVCSQPATPALCPAGQIPANLFFDNLENKTSGNWTTNPTLAEGNHWRGCTGSPDIYCSGFAASGALSFWGYDLPDIADSTVAMTSDIAIPAGGALMQFNHSYGFENGTSLFFDGGVVEYSTNGGATWADAGSLISAGATYGGVIDGDFGNPLAGRNAFVSDSFGYTASQLNLSSVAGQNIRFRFRIGTDSAIDDYGWFIDDVRIYTCATASGLSINDVITVEGNAGATASTFTVTLSPASAGTVTVNYATADGTALAGSDYTAASGTLTFAPGETSKTVTVNVTGDTAVEPDETFFVNLSDASGAAIADGQGVGTLNNDDSAILVAPVSHNFGDIHIGSMSGKAFTISNMGGSDLTVSGITVTGIDSDLFSVSMQGADACPSLSPTLPSLAHCTVVVQFSPNTAGQSSASLRIASNDAVSPVVNAALTGNGTLISPFDDVPEGSFAEHYINTIFYNGITSGCGGGNYCPDASVTRAQMAVFLEKGMRGGNFVPPAATGIFSDVPITPEKYWAADWIEKLYNDGITSGCLLAPLSYCPDDEVTRAQMAVFIVKALGEAPAAACTGSVFNDVNASMYPAPLGEAFCRYIETFAELGITSGCGGGNFCPDASVTRAQMAVFLGKAFLGMQ